MIQRLTVSGLRGFSEEQSIEFAVPNGNPGSGLTVLVGSNNSGKTTVLEALGYFNSSYASVRERGMQLATERLV